MEKPSLTSNGKMRRQRTKAYEHAINGLLTKRSLLIHEYEREADVAILTQAIRILGYEGEIDAIMPAAPAVKVFRPGGLRQACMDVLKAAERPLTSREIAERVYVGKGADYIARATMRISKCLKADLRCGNVIATRYDGGSLIWESV